MADGLRLADAEVGPPHALSGVAVAAIDLADLRHAVGCDRYARADGVAIRFGAGQTELHPVAAAFGDAAVEQGLLVRVGLEEIEAAVVIEIRYRDAAAVQIVIHTGVRRDFAE